MKIVVQRVRSASVQVAGKIISEIKQGCLVFVGVGVDDTPTIVEEKLKDILSMRIYENNAGKMFHSISETGGEILVVSQFTLYANFEKGNRPSFHLAAKPELARPLFEAFVRGLQRDLPDKVSTGVFGADMQVSLCNDGPVTIILE